MKFFITMPALLGKYFEVDSLDRLSALIDATGVTVWTEDEWTAARLRSEEMGSDLWSRLQKIGEDGLYKALLLLKETNEIDDEVYHAAFPIALMLDRNPPRIFSHGPKSVVFTWTEGTNNLYLTISLDKITALFSGNKPL